MKQILHREANLLAQVFFPKINAFSRIAYHVHIGHPVGLTPQQVEVVMELDQMGSLRLSDLSKSACVTHGTMTVAVQKLLKKGLLIRKKDPTDERAIRLGLSAKGKAVAIKTHNKTLEVFNFICEELSEEERKKLIDSYQFLLKTYQTILNRKVLKS
ncbi:MAG: MarR family transcriptional regulator [Candidatus Omnitrophota bacterium]